MEYRVQVEICEQKRAQEKESEYVGMQGIW